MKASAASSERDDHPSPSDDLDPHEAVFGWEGWSLSVPRPGKRIMEPKGDETAVERHDPAAADRPLITRLAPTPKTLPRLPAQINYKVRDLVGNRYLIPSFLYNGQNLREFPEVFQNRDAALGNGENYASFTDHAFLHKTLLHQEVKVFFENAAVNVSFVHHMG